MMRSRILLVLLLLIVILLASCSNDVALSKEKYDLGLISLENKNYSEAIALFSEAITLSPETEAYYLKRAKCYIAENNSNNNLDKASEDYQSILKISEENTDAWIGQADIAIRKSDYEEAISILNEAMQKTNNNSTIASKLNTLNSGNIVDSSGNLRRRVSRSATGVLMWYHDIFYDEMGKKQTVVAYLGNGIPNGTVNFKYDDQGRELVCYWMSKDTGDIGQIKNTYEDNIKVSSEWYNIDDMLLYTFKYDSKGQKIEKNKYDDYGNKAYYATYVYDNSGKMLKSNMYSGTGELWWYNLYEYDQAGNVIRDCRYTSGGETEEYTIYKYDIAGKLNGYEKYDSDNNLISSGLK